MAVARIGLYYPYVHFRNKSWLKVGALYWPKIARIVPMGYPIRDDPVTRALIDDLDFIVNIPPESGKSEAGRLMMGALISDGGQLAGRFKVSSQPLAAGRLDDYRLVTEDWANALNAADPKVLAGLHRDRMFSELSHTLVHETMAVQDDPWLGVHPKWAWVYMCVLAEQLAKSNNLYLVTDQVLAHAETNGWTSEKIVMALNEVPLKYAADQELETVIGMLAVRLVIPAGLAYIPVEKIIYIRQRYGADFDAFQDVVTTVATELRDEFENIAERAVLEAYLTGVVKSRFERPLADLRKALKGLGIDTAFTAANMKFALPAAVVASGGVAAHQPVLAGTGAAAFSLLTLGRTARKNWAERSKPSAASYLWRIERSVTPRSLIKSILHP